jgi:hypothetical protein
VAAVLAQTIVSELAVRFLHERVGEAEQVPLLWHCLRAVTLLLFKEADTPHRRLARDLALRHSCGLSCNRLAVDSQGLRQSLLEDIRHRVKFLELRALLGLLVDCKIKHPGFVTFNPDH